MKNKSKIYNISGEYQSFEDYKEMFKALGQDEFSGFEVMNKAKSSTKFTTGYFVNNGIFGKIENENGVDVENVGENGFIFVETKVKNDGAGEQIYENNLIFSSVEKQNDDFTFYLKIYKIENGNFERTNAVDSIIDFDNYYTKEEINFKIDEQNQKINEITNEINENAIKLNELEIKTNDNLDKINANTSNIEINANNINEINQELDNIYNKQEIDNKLNLYYNKQDIDLKINDINNSISQNTQKIDELDQKNIDLENDVLTNENRINELTTILADGYYQKREIDMMFQARDQEILVLKNQLQTKISENQLYKYHMVDTATKVIDIGNGKRMLIFQITYSGNYRNSGSDYYGVLPSQIKNLTNLRYVESFEYNFIQKSGQTYQKVFTNYIGNIACSLYAGRLYLRNENTIPSYAEYARFKIIVGV